MPLAVRPPSQHSSPNSCRPAAPSSWCGRHCTSATPHRDIGPDSQLHSSAAMCGSGHRPPSAAKVLPEKWVFHIGWMDRKRTDACSGQKSKVWGPLLCFYPALQVGPPWPWKVLLQTSSGDITEITAQSLVDQVFQKFKNHNYKVSTVIFFFFFFF